MKKSLLVVVVGIAMLIPSVAFAGSSTCQGYSQKTCPPTSNTTTSPAPSTSTSPAPSTSTAPAASTGADTTSTSPSEVTTSSSTGTLPFTGLDVAALMVGASVLLGGGLVMRYLSRDQQD